VHLTFYSLIFEQEETMDGNTIIRSERAKNGVIIHHAMPPFPPVSEQETYFSRAVRCGISWPMPEKKVPGYFCIFGEEWDPQCEYEGYRNTRGKLRFLAEYVHENLSLLEFCKKLGEDTTRLYCDSLYSTGHEDYAEELALFAKYLSDQHQRGYLQEAPYWKKPGLAIGIMQDWQKRALLDIPHDTVLYGQLKNIQAIDLEDLPEKFFAVNALCFVVAAFEVHTPSSGVGFVPRRVRRSF
jgi:hypothetical protein